MLQYLFAVDTNLFRDTSNIFNVETNLNVELEKVSQWFYPNKLSLNKGKNSFSVFHSPQRIAHKSNLSISNMSVKSDNQVKHVERIFDPNLNWKQYLNELDKKVTRGIGLLRKIKYFVRMRNIILQLCYSS